MSRQFIIALLAGGLFGASLAVSGMADPQRVRGFLDLFGEWDATLAFVMGGALIPMAYLHCGSIHALEDQCCDLLMHVSDRR